MCDKNKKSRYIRLLGWFGDLNKFVMGLNTVLVAVLTLIGTAALFIPERMKNKPIVQASKELNLTDLGAFNENSMDQLVEQLALAVTQVSNPEVEDEPYGLLVSDWAAYGNYSHPVKFNLYKDKCLELGRIMSERGVRMKALFLSDDRLYELFERQFPIEAWGLKKQQSKEKIVGWLSSPTVKNALLYPGKGVFSPKELEAIISSPSLDGLTRDAFLQAHLVYNNSVIEEFKLVNIEVRRSMLPCPLHLWLFRAEKDGDFGVYSIVDVQGAVNEILFKVGNLDIIKNLKLIGIEWFNRSIPIASDRILNDKKVIVATAESEGRGWLRHLAQKNGELGGQAGFEKSLVDEIIVKLGDKLGIEDLETVYIREKWSDLLDAPKQSKADIVISTISYRPDREHRHWLRFSVPYHETHLAFLHDQKDGKIKEYLKSWTVGVKKGTTAFELISSINRDTQGKHEITSIAYDEVSQAITALQKGEIDSVLSDFPSLEGMRPSGDKWRIDNVVDDFFPQNCEYYQKKEYYVIGIPVNDPHLHWMINSILHELESDGTIETLKLKSQERYESLAYIRDLNFDEVMVFIREFKVKYAEQTKRTIGEVKDLIH